MLRAQFCVLQNTLSCFLASEPFSSESATYSRPNRIVNLFVRVHVFLHMSMHVLQIPHICMHVFEFSYCALNFQVKGLKGFVRIGSEIAFGTSNYALFLKAQSSPPNWNFSKSSGPLLQTLTLKLTLALNPKHKASRRISPDQD